MDLKEELKGANKGSVAAYRDTVKKMFEAEIRNIMDEELRKAVSELAEEQKKAVRQVIEEQKKLIKEVVEEEKKAIWARVEDLRRSIENLV